MSSGCNRTKHGVRIVAVVLGAVLMHRAEAAPTMKVCVDSTNPTSSMDMRVARAALKTQGYAATEVPFIGHGKQADDGLPVGRFAKMARMDCALIMGFPVDVGSPHLPPGVKSTPAYASTGFVLVQNASGTPGTLSELPSGSEVGIAQLDTWAGLLYSTHPNIVMHVYPADADMLGDLEHHRISAAMTWQPFLESYVDKHRGQLRLSAHLLSGKHMQWNLVALYAPESQDAADTFGTGLQVLRTNGRLERLIAPYHAAASRRHDPAASSSADIPQRTGASRRCADAKSGSAKSRPRRPKPPALYTEAQATQGATEYFRNCAMCHGALLNGQEGGFPGPALKGADFADPSYDFHVGDIFHFVAKSMPAGMPGTLSDKQNVDIMAFILKQNGYPAGTTELTFEGATKSKVPIRYYGK